MNKSLRVSVSSGELNDTDQLSATEGHRRQKQKGQQKGQPTEAEGSAHRIQQKGQPTEYRFWGIHFAGLTQDVDLF
jgi:hypothetical protein